MILKQYYLGCLAHASYLLGDEDSATAIVVDPRRDVQQYIDDAEALGLRIRHVFLSHFHADFVAGHLELRDRCGGGMQAFAARPDLVWPTGRISAPMVAQELSSSNPPLLLDVRNPREWAARHIEGSLNVPLNHLQERIGEIPRDRIIAVHCAGGYRSSIAAGILHQHGITRLMEMIGGIAAWDASTLLHSDNNTRTERNQLN